MKRIMVLILVISPLLGISQPYKAGSIDGLKRDNGFNRLILGQEIEQISENKLAYLDDFPKFDADSCMFYEYHDEDVQLISNDLKVRFIAIRAYKYKIVNIYVLFDRSEGFNVLNNFLTRYGQFTGRPNAYANVFEWDCSSVNLTLKYQLDIDFGIAIYTCKALDQEIKEKSKQKLLQQKILANGN
jgi:hypothetical protein